MQPLPGGAPIFDAVAGATRGIPVAPSAQDRDLGDVEDPAIALNQKIKQLTGKGLDQFASDATFKLKGSFRPEGSTKDDAIEMGVYKNGKGPYCYYLTRHFTISYEDPLNPFQDVEHHFTKKIYTNVEAPMNYEGEDQAVKQRLASIAATMYADVVEAAILKEAGHPNDLSKRLENHIGKIQKDRFVHMEFFSGDKALPINPKGKTKLLNDSITHVRFNMRNPNKGIDEKGDREEGILLDLSTVKKKDGLYTERLMKRTLKLKEDKLAPEHLQKIAKSQDLDAINNSDDLVKAGITRAEYYRTIAGEMRDQTTRYHELLSSLRFKEDIERLFDKYSVQKPSQAAVQLLPSRQRSVKEKILSPFKKSEPVRGFPALEALKNLPADDQELIKEASQKALLELQKIHDQIKTREQKINDVVGIPYKNECKEREDTIKKLQDFVGIPEEDETDSSRSVEESDSSGPFEELPPVKEK